MPRSRSPRRGRGGGIAWAPAVGSEPNIPSGPPPPAVLVAPNVAPLSHRSTCAKRPSIGGSESCRGASAGASAPGLRLTLSAPARPEIVVQRRVRGHRIRAWTRNVDASAGRVSIPLPRPGPRPCAEARALPRVGRDDRHAAGNRSTTLRVRSRPADRPHHLAPRRRRPRGGRAASAQSVADDLARAPGGGESRWTSQSRSQCPAAGACRSSAAATT